MNRKIQIALISVGAFLILAGAGGWIIYSSLFAAPQFKAETEQLTVPLGSGDFSELSKLLKDKGFIKNETGFKIAYFKTMGINISATTCVDCFTPGAYK